MHNNIKQEIKQRISVAHRCYFGLQKHRKSHVLSRSVKVSLYKAHIRLVIVYENRTQTVSEVNEHIRQYSERKILRKYMVQYMKITCGERHITVDFIHFLQMWKLFKIKLISDQTYYLCLVELKLKLSEEHLFLPYFYIPLYFLNCSLFIGVFQINILQF